MEPRLVSADLGPKQTEALNGPVDPYGPEMLTYECKGCGGRFADVGLYFYGTSSTKCTWCSKFPKAKNERQIKSQ